MQSTEPCPGCPALPRTCPAPPTGTVGQDGRDHLDLEPIEPGPEPAALIIQRIMTGAPAMREWRTT